MPEREIPGSGYDSKTRTKIMDEALKLFAINGYGSVSIRDLCKAVGLKSSTFYYHYENGKEALFDDIMQRFENGYRHYFDWLKAVNMKAESLEELMDNMFNKEMWEMLDINGCLGIALAIKEQHNESVRKRVFELFHQNSIESMKEDFDRLIAKGVIPPSDTKTIAMIIMNNILVINDMRIHEYIGAVPSVNCVEMYGSLKRFITNVLRQGV
jgi:AcrR family transcriptional regulator